MIRFFNQADSLSKKEKIYSDYMNKIQLILDNQSSQELLEILDYILNNRTMFLTLIDLSYYLSSKLDTNHKELVSLLNKFHFMRLKSLDLSNLNMHLVYGVELGKFFQVNGAHLVELSLRNCNLVEPLLARNMIHMPNLEMLDVSENKHTDGTFLSEIKNDAKIDKLFMTNCSNISKANLHEFLVRYHKLTHLGLSRSANYSSNKILRDFFPRMYTQLRVFKYNFYFVDTFLKSRLAWLDNLVQLDLSNSHFDNESNTCLAELLYLSNTLRSLILTGCVCVNDEAFTSMEINAPLRELFLSDAVTDKTIRALQNQDTVQNKLIKLSLAQSELISPRLVVYVFANFKRLEKLQVNHEFLSLTDQRILIERGLKLGRKISLYGLKPCVLPRNKSNAIFSYNRVEYGNLTLVFEPMKKATF